MFGTKTYKNNDDYMTPKSAWQNINHLIPDGIIWEAFYGDGTSGDHLRELGHEVIHEPQDFFTWTPEYYDVIVSNPPFSLKKEVFTRLRELDKPFIMISPASMISYKYFRELYANDENLKIIIPQKRIQFIKYEDGNHQELGRCNFDCFYYCYKVDLPHHINYLT